MDSPKGAFIKNLLNGPGFTPLERALSGLTQGQATIKPANSPHSIADIVSHLNFWQSWALTAIHGEPQPMPAQAADGWVGLTSTWDNLVEEFLAGLEKAKTLTDEEALLQKPFDPETKIGWGFEKHSVGEVIVDVIAVHNAHHLGQIILLRRMLGACLQRVVVQRGKNVSIIKNFESELATKSTCTHSSLRGAFWR